MQSPDTFMLSALPSRTQQRFEARYAEALGLLGQNGFRWEIGPVEPLPPNEHCFPRLARHVNQAARPWRWISVRHEQVGQLGYLALLDEGTVRAESGAGLTGLSLMAWGTRKLDQAACRIAHQNRINTVINAQRYVQARRELPWVRAACLVVSISALVAAGVGRALIEGWLITENEYLHWLMVSLSIVAGCASTLLGLRWYQLRQWRAR